MWSVRRETLFTSLFPSEERVERERTGGTKFDLKSRKRFRGNDRSMTLEQVRRGGPGERHKMVGVETFKVILNESHKGGIS